jgi:hypothetical protein
MGLIADLIVDTALELGVPIPILLPVKCIAAEDPSSPFSQYALARVVSLTHVIETERTETFNGLTTN